MAEIYAAATLMIWLAWLGATGLPGFYAGERAGRELIFSLAILAAWPLFCVALALAPLLLVVLWVMKALLARTEPRYEMLCRQLQRENRRLIAELYDRENKSR